MGHGRLRWFILRGVGISQCVQLFPEWMVDTAGLCGMPTHDGKVGFPYLPGGELFRQQAGSIAIECKQQHPGSRFVEPVYRVDFLPDLVAGHLDGELRFMPVNQAAVNQQARRFVDGYEVGIVVDNVKHDHTEIRALPTVFPATSVPASAPGVCQ